MPEAVLVREAEEYRLTSAAAVSVGDVWQLPSGEAAVYLRVAGSTGLPTAGASGDRTDYRTSGKYTLPLTASITTLSGGRAYWDHSANLVHFKKVNDRDFYLGRFTDTASGTHSGGVCEVDLNKDPPYDIDIARDAFISVNNFAEVLQIGTRAKVGATAGWVVAAADNLPYVATLAASQTGSTLIIPINGLRIGDIIAGFTVNAQIESAGGAVTIDGDLRAVTNVAAEPTDASIGTMTQVSVTADTASAQAKSGLSETVTAGKSYYLKITATTAASTDIILQHCEVVITRANSEGGIYRRGGSHSFVIPTANCAVKLDMLSVEGFSKNANPIIEFTFRVVNDGAGSAVDVSIGAANDTHATDADSITDSLFMHLNANDVNVYFESDDGTTEVAATDSTTDYTEGSALTARKEVWMDFRNPADVQIYVDGVLVLPASVFNIDASVATWKLLVHIEKTAAADAYEFALDKFNVRFSEQ